MTIGNFARRLLSVAVVFLGLTPGAASGETHDVLVYDFYYQPINLTINQDDTVRWIWIDDFHDVRSGLPPGQPTTTYDDAFNSPIEQAEYVFSTRFDRSLLVNTPAPGNVYQYFCSPHFIENMVGSITVVRRSQDFVTQLTEWQEVPATGSSAVGSCTGTLSADETQFTINCPHNVSNITAAYIQYGFVGTTGPVVCDLGTSNPLTATCTLTQTEANQLWDGGYYVNILSTSFPTGEIRGQLARTGALNEITGTVSLPNNQGLADVTVSDGTRTAKTNSLGVYTLTGVPGGVYQLEATKPGYHISPLPGVNPTLINGLNVNNRSFAAVLGDTCDADSDGDGICDDMESDDGSNATDRGSYRNHLSSPIYVLWNGFIQLVNILELVNTTATSLPVTVSLYDITGQRVSQQQYSISGRGQQDIIVNSLPGFTANSYGLITIEHSGVSLDPLDGRMSYYRYRSDQSTEFAFSVPFVKPLIGSSGVTFNTFQPSLNPVDATNVVAQWLALVNLSSQEKVFTIRRFAQDGTLLSLRDETVGPLARVDLEAGHTNPGPSAVGLHVIDPVDGSAPYLAQLFRYGLTQDPSQLSFAYPLLARPGNGEQQAVSISRGAEAENWLELANTSAAEVSVTLKFYNSLGAQVDDVTTTLDAYAQEHFYATSRLASGASGMVIVTPSQPNSVIGQSMFYFRDSVTGGINAMYGSPLAEPLGSRLSGSYNLYLEMYNWLRVVNTSASTATMTLRVYGSAPTPTEEVHQLAPHAGVDLGLHETSRFGTAANTFGVITIDGSSAEALYGELLRLKTLPSGIIDFTNPTAVR